MSVAAIVPELTTVSSASTVALSTLTFKARIALRTAMFVANPAVSITEVERVPGIVATVATKAIANESNR